MFTTLNLGSSKLIASLTCNSTINPFLHNIFIRMCVEGFRGFIPQWITRPTIWTPPAYANIWRTIMDIQYHKTSHWQIPQTVLLMTVRSVCDFCQMEWLCRVGWISSFLYITWIPRLTDHWMSGPSPWTLDCMTCWHNKHPTLWEWAWGKMKWGKNS